MNKIEMIERIAEGADIPKSTATRVLDIFIQEIIAKVKKGEKVTLVGFGTFRKSDRKARTGRDPRTGATINIAATAVPAFRAGKEFKEAVKEEREG